MAHPARRAALLSVVTALAACSTAPPDDGARSATQAETPTVTPLAVADVVPNDASSAGATLAVAGDGNIMYAVSFNAGVWRWSLESRRWIRLTNGPAHAYSIAVDPSDARHVVVGERDGDLAAPSANHSGIWESTDAGATWPTYFDPRASSACSSQAVASVAITSNGSVVAATTCGVVVKRNGVWGYASTPFGNTPVTAVAASPSRVWARDESGNVIASSDDGATWTARASRPMDRPQDPLSDRFTLAATDAYVMEIAVGAAVGDNAATGYYVYDVAGDRWAFHDDIYDQDDPPGAPLLSLNGTDAQYGGHSRRFAKAYAGQLYVLDGQDAFVSTGVDATTLHFTWKKLVSGWDASAKPPYQNQVHSELWDVHTTPTGELWASTDGGVYRNALSGAGWATENAGLHTYHVHEVWVDDGASHLAFAAQDNDGWTRAPDGKWSSAANGDSNALYADADGASSIALIIRHPESATIDGYGQPTGDSEHPDSTSLWGLHVEERGWGAHQQRTIIAAIQSKPSESVSSPLDLVLLADMPFLRSDGSAALTYAQPRAIIRNATWILHPDTNAPTASGWSIMADNVPGDVHGIAVSNGHLNPVLYAYGDNAFYRADGNLPTSWTALPVLGAGAPAQLLVGSAAGPVWVNPFAANVIYALTAQGVRVTSDGGATWTTDAALTSLITRDGAYPLRGDNDTHATTGTGTWTKNGGNYLATLSSMAFDRASPGNVAASSPFGGVFIKNGSGPWMDLTASLPVPRTAVSSVARTGNLLFVAMEGRGIAQMTLPCFAKTACTGGQSCGTQDDGCGNPIACGTCAGGYVCDGVHCLDPNSPAACRAKCTARYNTCIDDPTTIKSQCGTARTGCFCECSPPNSCASTGAACGAIADGCNSGVTINCGSCQPGFVCQNNQCACVPSTSCGRACGPQPDGCGGTLQCPPCGCTCIGKRCGAQDGCGHSCPGYCTRPKTACTQDGDNLYYCGYAGLP